jgi:hypothetical protein
MADRWARAAGSDAGGRISVFWLAKGSFIMMKKSGDLMSADFDDMASKAKAAHEARMAQQDRQDTAQRDDRGRIVDAAVAALTADS